MENMGGEKMKPEIIEGIENIFSINGALQIARSPERIHSMEKEELVTILEIIEEADGKYAEEKEIETVDGQYLKYADEIERIKNKLSEIKLQDLK